MRHARTLLLVLGLTTLAFGLTACSQVKCAWQNACDKYKQSCEPLPSPPQTVDPIYDVDCGRGQVPEGHGAFKTPRQGP